MNKLPVIALLLVVITMQPSSSAYSGSVICSNMYSGFHMGNTLDISADPYCYGDFIIDQVKVIKQQYGAHLLSLNIFNTEEAEGVLYVYDANNNRVE